VTRRLVVLLVVLLGVVLSMLSGTAPYVVVSAGPTPTVNVSGDVTLSDPSAGRYLVLTVRTERVSYISALWRSLGGEDLRGISDAYVGDPDLQWDAANLQATRLAVQAATSTGDAAGYLGMKILVVEPSSPAFLVGIRPGDVIVAIDAVQYPKTEELRTALTAPGTHELTLRRDGEQFRVSVPAGSLGVSFEEIYRLPRLDPGVSDVVGASAGLLLTLAYYDALTSGDLSAGRTVAATGAVDRDGNVYAIESVSLKLQAAIRAGADVFIFPVDNRGELPANPPSGMEFVAVRTTGEAVAALCARGGMSPRCI
jgi:PDZ domain-containing secreted protein